MRMTCTICGRSFVPDSPDRSAVCPECERDARANKKAGGFPGFLPVFLFGMLALMAVMIVFYIACKSMGL